MTVDEAIKYLIKPAATSTEIGEEKQKEFEAYNMAIEALENKPTPCEKCIHVKSCRKVIILKNRTYKLIKYCSQWTERREP